MGTMSTTTTTTDLQTDAPTAVTTTTTTSPVSECGEGWQHGSYVEVWSDNCYWLMRNGDFVYREECRQACNDVGGHLCSIHSDQEEEFVMDLIHKHGSRQ